MTEVEKQELKDNLVELLSGHITLREFLEVLREAFDAVTKGRKPEDN